MQKTPYSIKRTGPIVTTVPKRYKIHSIIWLLLYCFCKVVRHLWWSQRLDIILPLTVTHRANLPQHCMAMQIERGLVVLNTMSTCTHYHAYCKYTGSLWNTLWTQNSGPSDARFRGVPLYLWGRSCEDLIDKITGGLHVMWAMMQTRKIHLSLTSMRCYPLPSIHPPDQLCQQDPLLQSAGVVAALVSHSTAPH